MNLATLFVCGCNAMKAFGNKKTLNNHIKKFHEGIPPAGTIPRDIYSNKKMIESKEDKSDIGTEKSVNKEYRDDSSSMIMSSENENNQDVE